MKQFRLLFLSVLLLLAPASFSQFGTLDSDFSDDGKVLTTFGEFHSSVRSIVIQPDGKIIAAGDIFDTNRPFSQFALSRYNSDGSLDEEFGLKGRIIENSGTQMHLHSMSLQLDDKILVAGIEFPSKSKTSFSLLRRYNSEGTVDLSFGTAGKVLLNSIFSTSMTVHEDGKIILVGYSVHHFFKPNNYVLMVMRFNQDGTLDDSFGVNGVVQTKIRSLGAQISVAVQNDNKIVVSADILGINDRDIIILRYLSDGSFDTDFGNKGVVVVDAKYDNAAETVKIQPLDGKIVVGGTSEPPLSYSFMLARLLPNGDLDSDFGDSGLAITEAANSEQLKSLVVQSDGMILTCGLVRYATKDEEIILKRFGSDGILDWTFGKYGVVVTDFDLRSGTASMAMQADGRIMAGGYAGGSSKVDFALLRYISGVKVEGQADEKNIFSISPNPVDKTVNLAFDLKYSQGLTVDLYDFNGRKIQNVLQRKDFPAGTNSYTIELPENLTKGIYFLNISNGKSTSNLKIVK
ncbi:T9SS type A sorting domain-containing protein [Flavobacterium sp. GT3R68]|uniref:T9SS type A sorting domain-containing protein n=1 Tax=Flavobacterium sp. GT3R68 TaxID=2594437 RepID=UPI000F872352|nr:T9SS type A sorting domain-containing protein [Flavobacterium sp. GT3R68]RTY93462.1 T9SS type A sorting domain-containing protein [Flavobacterium sp. GSN2]TRW92365.1 T9SS type A sorting domain-containing protein [Flavobacterium sp. GT3R68]